MSADGLQPSMEGIANSIMPLCGTSTNAAFGGAFASIMAMNYAADGAVGSCVVADTRRPFNLLNAHASA